MANNLVIVESPAKAKTIEKFLGKDFVVKSSFGHIRDLPKKNMGVDIENGFIPNYEISPDKKKTVAELRKHAKGKEVWLAADEDREGEAIAWHVCAALKLDPQKTKRIVFHEITKPAIVKAIEKPRTVDTNLVDAQQARRVLDRLVGYELSPVLWKKIKAGLSAGRVQSVAVRLIVEREREIEAFEATSVFKVKAEFDLGNKKVLNAELPTKFETQEDAKAFLEKCIDSDFTVESLQTKPGKKSPAAPFTTSTLQQEASRKLSFSVKQTMMVAQKLYEAGKITYMRTDSLNLSDQATTQAAKEIEKKYGKEFVEVRKYKTKSSGAQEAHEAIRPTDLSLSAYNGDRNEARLYDLIWKRTIASQMAQAKIEKTTATIAISKTKEQLVATGEVLKFDGFLKVYLEGTDDEENNEEKGMLPPLEEGQKLDLKQMMAKQNFARPRPRFTEASLVKKLEEMGIGRPSTYAPTISTVQDRKYVEKKNLDPQQRPINILTLKNAQISEESKTENFGAEKNKLFPTEIGKIVTDFLVKYFENILDYGFTAKVEEEFDQIAEGKQKWNNMLKSFYTPFHTLIEDSGGISKEEASMIRELGVDPKTKKPVFAKLGRFGPMIQIGTKDDEEKPKFASIPEGLTIEKITFEEAMAQFDFPKNIGKTPEGDDVLVSLGRFGPYLKIGKLNVSLKKDRKDEEGNVIPGDDPSSITLARALELYEEKKELEKKKYIAEWPEEKIQVLRGPYGIYIKHDKRNVRIPKSVENPEKLTLKECQEIIEKTPVRRGRKK